MTKYLVLYLGSAIVFFAADFVWLTTMSKAFYRPQIGSLLLDNPNLMVAGLFYLAYLVGLTILVTAPAGNDIMRAALLGAVLGFVAYGTYDLTNLSTVRGFTPAVAIVDIAWGTALTAASAAAGVWFARLANLV